MQKSQAYISKWCVREAGKALKQVLVVVILDNRGSICLRERERKRERGRESTNYIHRQKQYKIRREKNQMNT